MILNVRIKMALVLLMAALITGCVQINTPQITNLMQLMSPPEDPLDQHKWQLQIGEYQTTVYLMKISGQSVFVSEAKDVLVFAVDSGLTQISVPAITDAQIVINDTFADHHATSSADPQPQTGVKPVTFTRQIIVNNALFETQICGQWLRKQSLPQTQQLECQGATMQTHERVFANDVLVQLTQFVPYINQPIVLTKFIR